MRDYDREEHTNWVHAMAVLRDAIVTTLPPHEAASFNINDIPREDFKRFEDAIQDWAFSWMHTDAATARHYVAKMGAR